MTRPHRAKALLTTLLTTVLAAGALVATQLPTTSGPTAAAPVGSAARAANPVTPGDFRGYGFDQCLAPTQRSMNRWLNHSPFLAVGIYISGDSRACRHQPNLTPRWISTQLRKGWRLLPITLGPQASCQPRFPRYADDFKISPKPGRHNGYSTAKRQGRTEGGRSVAAAQGLGIVPGSTLWYDLEGFNLNDTHCRESALTFLSGWTAKVRSLGYKAGVYSSAGSGIKALDDARKAGKGPLPNHIWIARWDGKANTSTTYIGEEGWRPGSRLKQYIGGHRETHGGVTINIDSNYVDLGRGMYAPPETHCGGVQVDHRQYLPLMPPWTGKLQRPAYIRTLQCLLKEAGYYHGPINGHYWPPTRNAAMEWQADHGFGRSQRWWRYHWVALLSQGNRFAVKVGSAGPDVRRLQRALNAASWDMKWWPIDGRFTHRLERRVADYRQRVGQPRDGIANWGTWKYLQEGRK